MDGFGAKQSPAAGTYVNGALCPFTAGELARGAFENGYEEYGWDILSRIDKMVARDDGKIFFLYHPITGEPQGGGPSAWGATASISRFCYESKNNLCGCRGENNLI